MSIKNSYLYIGKSLRKARLLLLLALVCSAMTLAACGVQVGTSNNYISERNVAPKNVYAERPKPAVQTAKNNEWVSQSNSSVSKNGKSIVATARKQTGIPYRYGGTTPKKGFDCSGLIFWVYGQHGVSVPRVAKAQATYGKSIPSHSLQPGDIVAFRINGGYHTGIYSGNGKFIHSPRTGTLVREDSLSTAYWKRNFIGARRVL